MPPAPTSQPLVIETPRAEAPVRTKSDPRWQLSLATKPSSIRINFFSEGWRTLQGLDHICGHFLTLMNLCEAELLKR